MKRSMTAEQRETVQAMEMHKTVGRLLDELCEGCSRLKICLRLKTHQREMQTGPSGPFLTCHVSVEEAELSPEVVGPEALFEGVWKYVIVEHGDALQHSRELRFARLDYSGYAIDHAKMLRHGETATGAGSLAVVDSGEFILSSAASNTLEIDGDRDVDEAIIALVTGMSAPVKRATTSVHSRKATAAIDYDEALAIATLNEFNLELCLAGEAMLTKSGAKLVYITRREGWMLYGYAQDGSDVIETLKSIVAHGRVKLAKK